MPVHSLYSRGAMGNSAQYEDDGDVSGGEPRPRLTRIAIIDDDSADRKSICRLLSRAPIDYEVHEFSTAESALSYMDEVDVDCILLDVHLPNCSGVDFLDSLASKRGARRPGVLVVSGDDSQRVGVEMIKAGAQEFVQKADLDSVSLCEAIERVVLETRVQRRNERYAFSEKLASLNQLVASAAHEINNPAAIARLTLGAVEDMLKREGNIDPSRVKEIEKFRDLVGAADEALARIGAVVRDLENQTGSSLGHIHCVSLDQVVRSAMPTVTTLDKGGRKISYSLGSPRTLMGDLPQLARVVFDVVANAVEATGNSGSIQISTIEHATFGELIIDDDGPGIPSSQLESVLEPLFSTRRSRSAIGMGLPRANATIERHGGELEITRSHWGGARIVIKIPFEYSETIPLSTPTSSKRHFTAGSRPRILIVDDEPEIRKSYQRVLNLDCDVDCAQDVREALSLLNVHEYDAILCDVIMPDQDGTHLAKVLLDRMPEQADGLVFCSGGVLHSQQQKFVSNWANGYLRKPLSAEELRTCLLDFIRRRRLPPVIEL